VRTQPPVRGERPRRGGCRSADGVHRARPASLGAPDDHRGWRRKVTSRPPADRTLLDGRRQQRTPRRSPPA